ncbi:hypothetical protein [Halobacillus litoralis]|uniref:Uncharacterized protein n=1 Tax=Halobacillus litoralis TaxID=45668 RepID=A0A410MJG6_9BACI|nr:hypothetical protein [Halobacillus litoralis]QAS54853.1 hypothetical protein HLI_21620 [Halobacillus litoralis]
MKENEVAQVKKNTYIFSLIKKFIPATFFLTLISSFLYCVGYSFLYGYFIGGSSKGPAIRVIELFANPAPFNIYTVIIMGVFIVISLLLLMILIEQFLGSEKKTSFIAATLIMFCVFQFLFTLLFINGLGEHLILNVISSFLVWIVPLFLVVLLIVMVTLAKWPLLGVPGFLFGIISSVFLSVFFNTTLNELILLIVLFFSALAYIFLGFKLRNSSFYRGMVVFPLLFLIVIFVVGVLLDQVDFGELICLFILTFVISTMCAKAPFIHKYIPTAPGLKLKNWKSFITEAKKSVEIIFEFGRTKKDIAILLVVILIFLTIIPQFLFLAGQYIRELTYPFQDCVTNPPVVYKETIEYNGEKYKGYIFNETDSKLYIADSNWELKRIVGRNLVTYTTPKDEIKEMCQGSINNN